LASFARCTDRHRGRSLQVHKRLEAAASFRYNSSVPLRPLSRQVRRPPRILMSDLHHECGIAAIYHLPGDEHPLCPEGGPEEISRLLPRMLLDIQNRGQLAAGMTSYNPTREQLLATHKEVGTVTEAFRLSHRGKADSWMREEARRSAS